MFFYKSYKKMRDINISETMEETLETDSKEMVFERSNLNSKWDLKNGKNKWKLYITENGMLIFSKVETGEEKTYCILDLIKIHLDFKFFSLSGIIEFEFKIDSTPEGDIERCTFETKNGLEIREYVNKSWRLYYKRQLNESRNKTKILTKVLKNNAGFISQKNWEKLHKNNLCMDISNKCPLC
jgi:hypothetical protein